MIVANFHNGRSHEVITSATAGVDHTLFLNNKGTTTQTAAGHRISMLMFRQSVCLWT